MFRLPAVVVFAMALVGKANAALTIDPSQLQAANCGPYTNKTITRTPEPPDWFDGGFAPPIFPKKTPAPITVPNEGGGTKAPVTVPNEGGQKSPTSGPSSTPTGRPTSSPSSTPTKIPTTTPTAKPSSKPTKTPTKKPTSKPSSKPSKKPTSKPSSTPTKAPTKKPTSKPSSKPTKAPTKKPTAKPSSTPTKTPTKKPTSKPSSKPTKVPTKKPTSKPSSSPTKKPTKTPTKTPSKKPTSKPSSKPTSAPVGNAPPFTYEEEHMHHTGCPNTAGFLCRVGGQNEAFFPPITSAGKTGSCLDPVTGNSVSITAFATNFKDNEETGITLNVNTPNYFIAAVYMKAGTGGNLYSFTQAMMSRSSTGLLTPDNKGISHISVCLYRSGSLTKKPTSKPTKSPTKKPTNSPTKKPTTKSPTKKPTKSPTKKPTKSPTKSPSKKPTKSPTNKPTKKPTKAPTKKPTKSPTKTPTTSPTEYCNVLIRSFDFETPDQVGQWSGGRTNSSSPANFTTFLGTFRSGSTTMSTTFRNLPPKNGMYKKLVLQFDLYEIDDWEAGNPGSAYVDLVSLVLNGNEVILGSYRNQDDEQFVSEWNGDIHYTSESLNAPVNMGFGTFNDQKHKVTVEIPYRWVHDNATITIGFRASMQGSDEAAGFDNIKLFAVCDDPKRAPTARPTLKRNTPSGGGRSPGAWGDPHVVGWMGNQVNVFARCDLVLASVPNYAGIGLRIHLRTESGVSTYSFNQNIALQVGSDILEMDSSDWRNTTLFFNKQPVTLAHLNENIGKMGKPTYYINGWSTVGLNNYSNLLTVQVSLENGDIVQIRSQARWLEATFFRFTSNFQDIVGLQGNYSTGQFLFRNGTVAPDPNSMAFGQDWQVRNTEPNLFRTARAPQFPAQCTAPTGTQGWISNSTARSICQSRNAKPELLDICTYDVQMSADPDMAYNYD